MPFRGVVFERTVQAYLESQGWRVHRARASFAQRDGKTWSNSNDLWGCIDLACVHPESGVMLIQCTTTGGLAERRRKVEGVPWPFMSGFLVMVAEARSEQDQADKRRWLRLARIHHFVGGTGAKAWDVRGVWDVTAFMPARVKRSNPTPELGESPAEREVPAGSTVLKVSKRSRATRGSGP